MSVANLLYGTMPLFAQSHARSFKAGLYVETESAGVAKVVYLGNGETRSFLPVVGLQLVDKWLMSAAIGTTADGSIVFCFADFDAEGLFAVKWWSKDKAQTTQLISVLRGEPRRLASDPGGLDSLWVLAPGDVLLSTHMTRLDDGSEQIYPLRVVRNNQGKPESLSFYRWELEDAALNPELHITDRRAPFHYIPADWVGRIIQVLIARDVDPVKDISFLPVVEAGELIQAGPDCLTLNLAFATGESEVVEVTDGTWVELIPDKQPLRLSPADAKERERLKVRVADMQRELIRLKNRTFASHVPKEAITRLGQLLDIVEGPHARIITANLLGWAMAAKQLMDQFRQFEKLGRRAAKGEILLNFTGDLRHRPRNMDAGAWVVKVDGLHRLPDVRSVRRKKKGWREGQLTWGVVQASDVALLRLPDKVPPGAKRHIVAHRPQGNLSAPQLATIAGLERRLNEPNNTFGLWDSQAAANCERAVENAFNLCPACGQGHSLTGLYHQLVGMQGATFCSAVAQTTLLWSQARSQARYVRGHKTGLLDVRQLPDGQEARLLIVDMRGYFQLVALVVPGPSSTETGSQPVDDSP